MKKHASNVILLLGLSFFFGYVVFAVGLGSFFPQLNLVAQPFVCGSDELQVDQDITQIRPGEKTFTVGSFCVDSTGAKRDVTEPVRLVTGIIYSFPPLGVMIYFAIDAHKKRKLQEEEYYRKKGLEARS